MEKYTSEYLKSLKPLELNKNQMVPAHFNTDHYKIVPHGLYNEYIEFIQTYICDIEKVNTLSMDDPNKAKYVIKRINDGFYKSKCSCISTIYGKILSFEIVDLSLRSYHNIKITEHDLEEISLFAATIITLIKFKNNQPTKYHISLAKSLIHATYFIVSYGDELVSNQALLSSLTDQKKIKIHEKYLEELNKALIKSLMVNSYFSDNGLANIMNSLEWNLLRDFIPLNTYKSFHSSASLQTSIQTYQKNSHKHYPESIKYLIKILTQFKKLEISTDKLLEQMQLYKDHNKRLISLTVKDIVYALTLYKNKEIHKGLLVKWATDIWFNNWFDFDENSTYFIGAIMDRLDMLDNVIRNFSDEQLSNYINQLATNYPLLEIPFVKLKRETINGKFFYSYKECNSHKLYILSRFLIEINGCNDLTWVHEWASNDEHDFGGTNSMQVDKNNGIIFINHEFDDEEDLMFGFEQHDFAQLLKNWEIICKQVPQEILILKEFNHTSIQTFN